VPRYLLYGLTIDSPFPLPARAVDAGVVDLEVRWGADRVIPDTAPAGEVVSQVEMGAIRYFTSRQAEEYVIRYAGTCEAVVRHSLDSVELICNDRSKVGLAELLFSGNVMAKVMTLAGHCVLHASAVEMGGKGFAFVGPPGSGKSTVAALLCASGARLVTDDVVRLIRDGGWACPAGTSQIRLREAASSLANRLDGTVRETQDKRTGVSVENPVGARLAALVFPHPSREATETRVERLRESDVLMRLTRYPRVLGWKDPAVLTQMFRWNARLARELPAYEAIIPWGPPFEPGAGQRLLELLMEPEAQ
jgi:hypothetical protein